MTEFIILTSLGVFTNFMVDNLPFRDKVKKAALAFKAQLKKEIDSLTKKPTTVVVDAAKTETPNNQ